MKRNDGLDLIRVCGAVLVVIGHAAYQAGVVQTVPLGSMGVALFFVLSGYLIPKVYEPGARYFVRRLARIWPGYWFAVAGFGAVYLFVPNAGELLMLQPLDHTGVIGAHANVVGVAWSLRVELLFYALVPIIVRLSTPTVVAFAGASYLLTLLPHDPNFPLAHLWRFLPGVLLARWQPRSLPWLLWPLGVGLIVLEGVLPSGLILTALGGTALVAASLGAPIRVPRWIVFGATISYGIFLWHQQLLAAAAPLGVIPMLAIAIPATLAAATISWYAIERPALRWSGRLVPELEADDVVRGPRPRQRVRHDVVAAGR